MAESRKHFPLVDLIKAIAAQCIVLHHLAWYGPMSDAAADYSIWIANIQSWLAEYGRYAVAAFLTAGGFLAARGFSPHGFSSATASPIRLILQRYIRLVGPYAIALGLAIIAATLARKLMVHDSIGHKASLKQLVSHLLLMHDLLGFEAISAGVWYVAIDFQLYALLVLLLWGGGQLNRRAPGTDYSGLVLVGGVALASLFYFNLDASWDASALYFFGAYALGIIAAWALGSSRPVLALLFLAVVGMTALLVEFRPRLAVSLIVALLLGFGHLRTSAAGNRIVAALSRHSYALFLVHFPVCLVTNAAITRVAPDDPVVNALGVILAWTLSNLASIYFHRYIELPLTRPLQRKLLTGKISHNEAA